MSEVWWERRRGSRWTAGGDIIARRTLVRGWLRGINRVFLGHGARAYDVHQWDRTEELLVNLGTVFSAGFSKPSQ